MYCLLDNTDKGAGFRKMVKSFDSHYDIPSHNHISRITLASLHATVKQHVKQEISLISHFSSTTYMWSSVGMVLATSYTKLVMNGSCVINACRPNIFLRITQELTVAEAMNAALETWRWDVVNQCCLITDNSNNIISTARILDFTVFATTYTLLSLKLCKMTVNVVGHFVCVRK